MATKSNAPTPSAAHLSEAQRADLARLLQTQLLLLGNRSSSQLQGLSQADHASEVLRQDPDDTTQRAGDQEVASGVSDLDSREFDAINRALQRIHGANYGLCVDCHEAIPFERLRVEPQALRCATCESLHERNH